MPAENRASLASLAKAAVVVLAMAGNDAAFSELVNRRQSTIRNLLRRLSGNRAMADDLAQQTFLQAWKNIRSIRSAEAIGGWLRQIAVHTWLQEARKSQVSTVPLDEAQHLPDQDVGSSATRIDLDRALAKLKDAERTCIVLSYNEGLSHGEIAEVTGWPLGTVKSHVSLGAERMRELLAGYGKQQ